MMAPTKSNTNFSEGAKSKGILDDYAERKHIATYSGTVEKTPAKSNDIVNKAYADSIIAGGAPEGTAVLSTGELITKYLRADGDGTSSWQTVAGGVDWTLDQSPSVINAANYVDNNTQLAEADITTMGFTKYVDADAVNAVATADDYLLNTGDTATGNYTFNN